MTDAIDRYKTALFALAVLTIFIFAPIAGCIAAFLVLIFLIKSQNLSFLCSAAMICIVFGTMNASKGLLGDWIWYSLHYKYIYANGIVKYLNLLKYDYTFNDLTSIGGVKPKLTEPVFYILAYICGICSGGSLPFFAFAITCIIYMPACWVAYEIAKKNTNNSFLQLSVVVLCTFVGVTFTLTLHLIRQELASTILLLAVWSLISKRPRHASALFVLASLTHNSSIIFAILSLSAYWVMIKLPTPKRISVELIPFASLIGVTLACAAAIGYLFAIKSGADAIKDDGQVDISVMAMDAAIFCAIFLTYVGSKGRDKFAGFVALMFLFMAALLVGCAGNKLLSLRMYFFLEPLRFLALAIMGSKIMSLPSIRGVAAIMMIGLGIAYCEIRVLRSPFDYQGGLGAHFIGHGPFSDAPPTGDTGDM